MPELTAQERWIFEQTLRTGNWDLFTERYFKLPKSGTWFTPEDRVEQYAQLHDAWAALGKPDTEMRVEVDGVETEILVSWDYMYEAYGGEPLFLLPHGFRMLPWLREFLAPSIPLGIAITGTGSGKCLPADAMVMCCDGTQKRIIDLQVSDAVWGVDQYARLELQNVVGTLQNGIRQILRVCTRGQQLRCTPNHKVLLAGVTNGFVTWRWVEARCLVPGDMIAILKDNVIIAQRVTCIRDDDPEPTFDIEVWPDHNFIANGIVTHNTAGVGIFAMMCCALFPGFRFLNVAPTAAQADLMLGEVEKWAGMTEFRKFIQESRGANPLWVNKPHPVITIEVYPGYPSTFTCQTVGRDATSILGGERDAISFDEAGLLENIEQALPILVTRLRGTRSTGDPRWTWMRWISNPSQNPELLTLLEDYERKQQVTGDAIALRNVNSSVNTYLTQKQLKQQAGAMDVRTTERWHGGSMEAAFDTIGIAERLIEGCKSEDLEAKAREIGQYDDGLGLQHYLLPPEPGREYMIVGDVGKSSLRSMSSLNVPCVMVLDITNFLEEPTRVVGFWWLDGEGSYKTFLDWMKRGMLLYRAPGYYDAQNVQTALEDLDGGFAKWPTTPVMLSSQARGKAWALTILIAMMDDKMLAWPYIKALWYQARIYDPKSEKKADDVIATLLTFTMALQVEGALWDKVAARYNFIVEGDELVPATKKDSERTYEVEEPVTTDRYWRPGI